MNWPDYATYQKLYGRFLKKGVERFFSKQDPKGLEILDLCAGGGQLADYALDHGAQWVTMVDISRNMLKPDFGKNRPNRGSSGCFHFVESTIEDYLKKANSPFDMVVCRQGANYWFKNATPEQLGKMVKPGGLFVFNTFGHRPSETPTIRSYIHAGVNYAEVSYMVGNVVHHVQTASGMQPHFNSFDWITHDEFTEKLAPFFITEEEVDGPSSMWYCWRK